MIYLYIWLLADDSMIYISLGVRAQERTPLFDGEAPPATTLTVDVRVDDFVGPAEDRDAWSVLSLSLEGLFGLPEALTTLGTSPEDFQNHPITYKATLLGELGALESLLNTVSDAKEGREACETLFFQHFKGF